MDAFDMAVADNNRLRAEATNRDSVQALPTNAEWHWDEHGLITF